VSKLVRFGVSLDKKLINAFDKLIASHNYSNRSQAIAELMRAKLVEKDWSAKNKKVAAIISLAYNHHRRELVTRLMDIQHDYQKLIISTQHIHLDHDNCLEIIAAKGKAEEILELGRRLKAVKGIKHASFTATTSGNI